MVGEPAQWYFVSVHFPTRTNFTWWPTNESLLNIQSSKVQ